MVFSCISGHSRYIDNSVKLRLSDNRTKTMNPSYITEKLVIMLQKNAGWANGF
jgi:hypothetical protein